MPTSVRGINMGKLCASIMAAIAARPLGNGMAPEKPVAEGAAH